MAETKPVAPQTNIKLIKNIICVLLVAAVVLAAIAFSGRNAALEENAALNAKLEEMTTAATKMEEDAAALKAELEAKPEEAEGLNAEVQALTTANDEQAAKQS